MKFYMKIHKNAQGCVVAVCDEELLGKVFEEKGKALDLKAHAGFYNGGLAGEKGVLERLKSFSSLNIVGRNAVALAIKAKLADKSQVCEIAGVPHVEIYKI